MTIIARTTPGLLVILLLCCFNTLRAGQPAGVIKVVAKTDQIEVTVAKSSQPIRVVELQPYEATQSATTKVAVAELKPAGRRTISIPRFDGKRDRIYSAFVAVSDNSPTGSKRFVETMKGVSQFTEPYPKTKSKKGLQVQMMEDAIALGVKHAGLNLNFGNLISLKPHTNDIPWEIDGRTFHFRRGAVEYTDQRVKTLSDQGMIVTLILLYYKNADADMNAIMLHPNYNDPSPNHLSAFNTKTPEGLAWFKACMEFIAHRYSQPDERHGRAVNYIVGNEVNSHWFWANMGRVSMEDFARDYQRTVRICHTAVRKYSSSSRVFISLEHHWNERYPGGDVMQAFPAKPFMDFFAMLGKTYGDYDWHVAFHPYPENLFEPRTWNDKSAHPSFESPRITFKNIEVLPEYMKRKELLYDGKQRRIILSEQGFHSNETPEGELWQAAAYCYAYYKIDRIEGIDSFILHRHVDHGQEGGLNLGLWRRQKESVANASTKKPIYDVFLKADTSEWEEAFEFALPVIGIKGWKEIAPLKAPRHGSD